MFLGKRFDQARPVALFLANGHFTLAAGKC